MSPTQSKSASEGRANFSHKLGCEMEYRFGDDAWYSVRLTLEGKTLTVKYCEFPDSNDETFNADDFRSADEAFIFRERFRPISSQLQDSECSEVKEGMKVCVSCEPEPSERKFFDATVEAVKREKHDKECSCTFLLSWLHGPRAGTMTRAKIENICLMQSHAQIDPQLTTFLKIAAEKFREILSNCSNPKLGCGFQKKADTSKTERVNIKKEGSHQSLGNYGYHTYGSIDDSDMGGGTRSRIRESDGCHFLVINNLERDASFSTIINFIHKQTSISPEVYMSPCLPHESYTRGVVMVGCLENLEKLLNFLNKSDQIITSSRGRPWVVSSISDCENLSTLFKGLKSTSQQKEHYAGDKAGEHYRVVLPGSSEYNKALKLRDMFLEFVNHQRGLHTRLVYEERKILLPPSSI